MSLFERLNNKRYDLQEIKKKTSSSASSGNNNSDQNISTSRRRIKKQIEVVKSTQPKISKIFILSYILSLFLASSFSFTIPTNHYKFLKILLFEHW